MQLVVTLCKRLIAIGKTEGLQEKMDVYLAADRLTAEEYAQLVAELGQTGESGTTTAG